MDQRGLLRDKTAVDNSSKPSPSGAGDLCVQSKTDSTEAEKIKKIKKPRSKKYLKALKMMDILSENDERIIEEMKKDRGLAEDADVSFTEDDMDAFREKMQALVEEELNKYDINEVFTGCYIPGCEVHSITPEGTILDHYSAEDIKGFDRVRNFAAKLLKHGSNDSVEICRNKIVHRNCNGDVIKIYDSSEI
ncbi:MAG: hypothetical protein K6F99_04980 [Lachnospiraceae bacterium]|nr:hypothetical protein [Lachnospiraceae bacterium]